MTVSSSDSDGTAGIATRSAATVLTALLDVSAGTKGITTRINSATLSAPILRTTLAR